jgi:thiopeptide-type bacteriocin biosynthesis protein
MGRFCHADDMLRAHVERYLHAEEALDPEAVFAEIVHVPDYERVGNVLFRPLLRPYEITFLGRSGAPPDRQLPLSDLLVSVVGEQVRLRSARLGCRVVPRLTAAHVLRAKGHVLYRFLGTLQDQGRTSTLGWNWGPLGRLPFLPRISSGRLVLARASWRLNHAERKALAAGGFEAAQQLRRRRQLPRLVELLEGENSLPIDLDNLLSVEMFVDLVQKQDDVVLVEMFPAPEQLAAIGPEGHFVHELVVPFIRAEKGKHQAEVCPCDPRPPSAFVPLSARRFPPGSEWFYAKLYTGPLGVDQLLREVVRPLVQELQARQTVDRWFFVRYADPDWHLRVRFHGEPDRLQKDLLPAMRQAVAPILGNGRVWCFQLDTYEREIERYGGLDGVIASEALFHADSEAVLAVVAQLAEDTRADQRWRLALYGSHLLLEALGLDLAGKLEVVRRLRQELGRQIGAGDTLRWQLGERFRKERPSLTALLGHSESDPGLDLPLAGLRARRIESSLAIAELRRCEQAGRLTRPLAELAESFVHMHLNRLLLSDHQTQELVLYDFLVRIYQSQAARPSASS